MSDPRPELAAAIASAEARRLAVRASLETSRANLPLRYWRQQAHFTTPAADAAMARKAVENGTAAVAGMLGRLGLTSVDLADRLELPVDLIEARLVQPSRAPLVMLDGEDAIAPGDAVAARAIAVAADTLTDADWTGGGSGTLRFYRPPGFDLDTTARDLYTLLWRLRDRVGDDPDAFPLDGIVFPKIEHPEEIDLVNELLGRAEEALGLRHGQIRVSYLIESGWAIAQLAEIGRRAAPRLGSLIFGLADFSADISLPAIDSNHPVADWARAEIIAVAGALGVPAIDGMTLGYPVADPALDAAANRVRWLDRMRLCYDDAVRARELGMQGKWVGHPGQLLAVLLAFEAGINEESVENAAATLAAYEVALAAEQGATMIGGVMSDRATDRHARTILRTATTLGRFEPARALALGVIRADELGDAERAYASEHRGGPR
jgi:citrate lyase beta subunit